MRVFCTLPNCGTEVSGKRFCAAQGGMLSEDMSEAEALRFSTIAGYSIIEEAQIPPEGVAPATGVAGGEGQPTGSEPGPLPNSGDGPPQVPPPNPETPVAGGEGGQGPTNEKPKDDSQSPPSASSQKSGQAASSGRGHKKNN